MKKVLDFDGIPVELNSSMGWLLLYREQFGHDILPDLMPAIDAALGLAIDLIGDFDTDEVSLGILLGKLDKDILSEALATVSGMGSVTLAQILWALAKNADSSIPGPFEWLNSFDTIPLDEIFLPVIQLIIGSCASKKKALLLAKKLSRKKSAQISSSSEEPTEA